MTYALVTFKVEDFGKWRAGFDSEEGVALRKSGGMKSYQLFCNEDDPTSLVILCEFDDQDTARKFMQSEELRKAHQESGAIGEPVPYFLEEVEKASV